MGRGSVGACAKIDSSHAINLPVSRASSDARGRGRVAAVPYDVVTTEEARQLADGNPLSFLHVSRPELGLPPDTNPYADVVYQTAQRELRAADRGGAARPRGRAEPLRLPPADGRHVQTGVAACYSVDEYDARRHPQAREDAEGQGRRSHAAHRRSAGADRTGVPDLPGRGRRSTPWPTRSPTGAPLFDFTAADGVRHTIWRVPAAVGRDADRGCWRRCRCSTSPTAIIARPARRARGSGWRTPGVAVGGRHVPGRRLPARPDAGAAVQPDGEGPAAASDPASSSRRCARRISVQPGPATPARKGEVVDVPRRPLVHRASEPAGRRRLAERRARRLAAARPDPGAAAGHRRRARRQAHRLPRRRPRHRRARARRRQRRGGRRLLDVPGRASPT